VRSLIYIDDVESEFSADSGKNFLTIMCFLPVKKIEREFKFCSIVKIAGYDMM